MKPELIQTGLEIGKSRDLNVGWRWNGIIAALLLLFALSLLGTWTQAAATLNSVRLPWLIAAAVLCSAGYLIFSSIWTFLVLVSLVLALVR